jgi:hypothetical protein
MNKQGRRENEKRENGLKAARRAVLIIIIVCIAGFAVLYRDELPINGIKRLVSYIDLGGSNRPVTDDVSIEYGEAAGTVCDAYKGRVAVLTSEYLKLYDNLGNEEASIETGYGEPAMESTDKYLLIYDRSGNKLSVINGTRQIFSHDFDYPIVSASINDKGYMGVVTGAQGYKAMVTVFDSSFKELYRCYSYENYVLDVAISPDNKNMSLILLNSKDGALVSSVAMYNFYSDKPTSVKAYNDLALYKVKYSGSDKLAAVGNKTALFLSKDGEERSRFDYNGAQLEGYSFDGGKYALALGGYSSDSRSTVVMLDGNGKTKVQVPVNSVIKDVCISGNSILVLGQGGYSVYSGGTGKLKKTTQLSNDVRQISLLDSSELLLITPAMVKVTRIN